MISEEMYKELIAGTKRGKKGFEKKKATTKSITKQTNMKTNNEKKDMKFRITQEVR